MIDLYSIIKALHVLSATVWVGGGLFGAALGLRAARSDSDEALFATMGQLAWCGGRIFVPAALATLASGLGMTWLGNLWLDAWVLIGLCGVAATMVLGMAVEGPILDRALRMHARGQTAVAARHVRRVLVAARFEVTLLVLVVVDMVLKPSFVDWPILAGMAAAALVTAGFSTPRALTAPDSIASKP
jgi:uncharacterized membrane protein